jgi:L-aminopeptidase/D-esterase-like protein
MSLFKIGHYTDLKGGTGCTVIICPDGTKGSGYARGISPGTREYALLSPFRKMEEIHALLLTGGSAFGLDAAAGVMRYLAERSKGYKTPYGIIPIVPAAVIFDLPVKDTNAYPLAENAYNACRNAKADQKEQGTIGAGTGATVGKWAGIAHMMKSGIGIAKEKFGDVWAESLAVVNSVGDIVDEKGKIIAGAVQNGKFIAETTSHPHSWQVPKVDFGENTVLVAVMTNANLSKVSLYYLAERAHNGIVQAVKPAHTSFDGDMVFSMSIGAKTVDIDTITQMSIEATRRSIINAVIHASSLDNIPTIDMLPRKHP